MDRTIIRNAIVISMDPAIGEHLDADVLIDSAKIAAVAPNIGSVDAREIDGRGAIVLPGFVDTHRHTWQCLLRNAAADWSLAQYFGGVRGVMGELYTPDDMYVANYLGALEALDGGITTLVDWSHNNNTPDHADMAIKGLQDLGIRAVYAYGNANREWFPVSDLPTNFDDVARVRKQHFSSDDGLVTMAFAARGPQFATLDQTERDFREARKLDLPITLHAGDGLWGLNHPVDQLNSRGLLGPRTTYVHCCTLSDHEFKLMADSGGTASLSAEVELNMGHGNPATLGCLKYGLRPSISIDICTSVGGDMFTQIRVLMAATRGVVNADALKEKKLLDPLPLTARDMLDFATLQGAKAANSRSPNRFVDAGQGRRPHHPEHRLVEHVSRQQSRRRGDRGRPYREHRYRLRERTCGQASRQAGRCRRQGAPPARRGERRWSLCPRRCEARRQLAAQPLRRRHRS